MNENKIEHIEKVTFTGKIIDEQSATEMWLKINELADEVNRINKILETGAPAKREEQYYNGRVMCVKSKNSTFTVGKIYPCIDGTLIDDDESMQDPCCCGLKSFEELSNAVAHLNAVAYVEFLEVKGEVTI